MFKSIRVAAVVFLFVLCSVVNVFSADENVDNGAVDTVAAASVSAVTVDGECGEWKAIEPIAVDAAGDVDANDIVDYTQFWVVRDVENIYFSYVCAKPLDWSVDAWRYNLFIDSDDDASTGYRGYEGAWSIGADYLVQGGSLFKFSGSGAKAWLWDKIGTLEYSVEGNQAEIKLPDSSIGINPGQKIRVMLHGDNVNKPDFVPDECKIRSILVQ